MWCGIILPQYIDGVKQVVDIKWAIKNRKYVDDKRLNVSKNQVASSLISELAYQYLRRSTNRFLKKYAHSVHRFLPLAISCYQDIVQTKMLLVLLVYMMEILP